VNGLAAIAAEVSGETSTDVPWEVERRLARFNHRYVQCLDTKRLDDWPGFFCEDGLYRIYPRENLEAGLPACLIYLDGHRMMRDRVLCLREVILYADNAVRHFLGAPAIRDEGDGTYAVSTNVLVIHSDSEGHSRIFCAGEYRDRIVDRAGTLAFLEKTVVVDTFTVPSHLAHPV
jgi:anthranilate 1,2-dioxygenase small subunit